MSVLIRRACSSAASLRRSLERRILLLEPAARASQLALPLQPDAADEEPDEVLGERGLADEVEERAHLDWILTLANEVTEESKTRLLRRLLARASQPAIVFTEYRDTLQHLAGALADGHPAHLHGGLTRHERDEALERFTSGGCSLLLATDAASEGLNLHHRCRLVINLELPWTPTRLEQRAGRVDRIGQSRRVHEVRLVASDTGEEHVLASLSRRQQRIRAAGAWLERPALEADIAAGLLTSTAGATEPDLSIPPFVVVGARRDEATREAQRLEAVRRLSAGAGAVSESRPVATLPHPCSLPRNTWAYRVLLLDAAGRLLLDTMLGAMTVGGSLDDRDDIRKAVIARADALGADLARSLAAPIARWTERERHLRDRLERDRARLAAPLMQRSLFDRRADRDATHQQAAVNAAVARVIERLDALAAAGSPAAACELAFARATR
jgi:hypothetical protein